VRNHQRAGETIVKRVVVLDQRAWEDEGSVDRVVCGALTLDTDAWLHAEMARLVTDLEILPADLRGEWTPDAGSPSLLIWVCFI